MELILEDVLLNYPESWFLWTGLVNGVGSCERLVNGLDSYGRLVNGLDSCGRLVNGVGS